MKKGLRAAAELSLVLLLLFTMVSFAAGIPKVVPEEVPAYAVKVVVHDRNMADLGTGSLIRYDLVLTANHVVRDRKSQYPIEVIFFTEESSRAKVVKTDPQQDLALLKISPTFLPSIRISTVDPEIGDEAHIGGFAGGTTYKVLHSHVQGWFWKDKTETTTVFSVKGESISGMSGGPVVGNGGKLIGILFGSNHEESLCPNAEAIQKFLRGYDMSKINIIRSNE